VMTEAVRILVYHGLWIYLTVCFTRQISFHVTASVAPLTDVYRLFTEVGASILVSLS
jgi:hypothetical protein